MSEIVGELRLSAFDLVGLSRCLSISLSVCLSVCCVDLMDWLFIGEAGGRDLGYN